MIKIKYKALFTIEIAHSYYKSGKSADFSLVPSASCAKLLSALGLRFLSTAFGGSVYARAAEAGGKDIIKSPLADGTKFSFLLKLNNYQFENISNVNLLRPAGSNYYFNNLGNNLAADNAPLLVANGEIKSVSDADLLPFKNGSFSYKQENTADRQTAELLFTDSGEKLIQTLDKDNNAFHFSFDLNKASNGSVRFSIEGLEKSRFYAIDASEQKDMYGVIEIFYKHDLAAGYQFLAADQSIVTAHYRIPFSNRATRWRYIVTRKFNPAISSVSVAKTNGSPLAFSVPGGSAEGTFVATSNNAIPFSEEPISGIKLSDHEGKVVIANLPNPDMNLIKTEGSDTFSDILITI